MGIVIKPAMRRHRRLQRILAGMAKRRMADIMGETQRLGQILVEAQFPRDGAADLRDFQAVGQAHAIMVAVRRHEHLRLVAQPPEADRVDDPVAITLEDVARPAHFAPPLDMEPPPALRRVTGIRGERAHLPPIFAISSPASLCHTKASPPALAILLTAARASSIFL